jgi:hypothetical protein
MLLCYAQPLVRSWHRYRTRLFFYRYPVPSQEPEGTPGLSLPLTGRRTDRYWSQDGYERTELLGLFIAFLIEHRWGIAVDSGWSDWDVEIHYHPWTLLQVFTAQEDHGEGKRLIRVRFRVRITTLTKLVNALGLAAVAVVAGFNPWCAAAGAGLLALLFAGTWWRGLRRAARAVAAFAKLAGSMNLVRIGDPD